MQSAKRITTSREELEIIDNLCRASTQERSGCVIDIAHADATHHQRHHRKVADVAIHPGGFDAYQVGELAEGVGPGSRIGDDRIEAVAQPQRATNTHFGYAAVDDWRTWALEGLRIDRHLVEVVKATVKLYPTFGPSKFIDLDTLGGHRAAVRKAQSESLELFAAPPWSDRHDQTAVRENINGSKLAGVAERMTIG